MGQTDECQKIVPLLFNNLCQGVSLILVMSGFDSYISRRNFIKTGVVTITGLAMAPNEMIGASGIDLKASNAHKLSDGIGVNRVVLDKNLVNGVNTLNQGMINSENTIYVIKSDFILDADINIPANCTLEFEGGTISGGKVTGVVLNDLIKPEWFGAKNDGITDCSEAVQNALNVCKDGGTVLFSEGSYAVKHCEVRRNCEIVGKSATLVGQPLQAGLNGFDYMFIADGIDYISFVGFTITGTAPVPTGITAQPENPLFYVNNGRVAKFESLFFDSVHSRRHQKWSVIGTNAVLLFASLDVNKTIVNNCEFKDCWESEWTWIHYVNKNRKDVELIFTNNYVHDYHNGNTPLNANVGNLIISNNTWENASYSGSLLNCAGYKTFIKDNVIRNCVASSVFDTCEYGQVYCDEVSIENNKVECLNALVVLTTAKTVIVKNNIFKALAAIQTYPYEGYISQPELRDTMPTNKLISITGNDFDCNLYDLSVPQIAYNGQRSGIFAGEIYCKGDTLIIRDNIVTCNYDNKLVPSEKNRHFRSVIRIANMDNIIIEGNNIKGLTPMLTSGTYMNFALIEQLKSVKVPYDDSFLKISSLSVLNNVIDAPPKGKVRGVQIQTHHQYLVVKNAEHDEKKFRFFTSNNVVISWQKSTK